MPTTAVDNRIKHDEVGLTAGTDRQADRQTDRQTDLHDHVAIRGLALGLQQSRGHAHHCCGGQDQGQHNVVALAAWASCVEGSKHQEYLWHEIGAQPQIPAGIHATQNAAQPTSEQRLFTE